MLQPYLLEVEGRLAGRFFNFSGGTAQAEVILEKTGTGPLVHKHVGSMKFEDMVLACGTGMSRAFYDWIGSSFGGSPKRLSGAVVQLDRGSKATGRLDFHGALVTSLVLPRLDSSSNKEAVMTVSVKPEWTRMRDSDGSQGLGVYTSALPKAWNIGSFRIQIDGLAAECRHVTKLSSLSFGLTVEDDLSGEARRPGTVPVKPEFSNFSLEIPGQAADGFYQWHEDFVVKGNNNSASEKNGSIEFLAPSSTKPYFVVGLSGLGIYGISSAFHKKSAMPVTVKLYCESMTFSAGAAAIR